MPTLQELAAQGARGMTTGLLGGPVDLMNLLLLGAGGETPVMGGEWIGDKLEGLGLLAPRVADTGSTLAELAGGLLSPAGMLAMATKAGKINKLQDIVELLAGGKNAKMKPSLASKSPNIFDPRPLPQREFHVDYPGAVEGAEGSRLRFDIDGNPLSDEAHIYGRRTVEGLDEGMEQGEANWLAGRLQVPVAPEARTGRNLKGDHGRLVPSRKGDEKVYTAYIDKALSGGDAERVLAHELAHRIDQKAFGIRADGHIKKLREIARDLV